MPKQISIGQQEALVCMMQTNSKLFTGKLDNSFTKKDKDKAWSEVADNLNGMFGATEDVKSWMKTWGDMKSLVKKKAQKLKVKHSETGNKSDEDDDEPLTPLQMKIADLMGPIPAGGHLQSVETMVGTIDSNDGIGVLESAIANQCDHDVVMEFVDISALPSSPGEPVPSTSGTVVERVETASTDKGQEKTESTSPSIPYLTMGKARKNKYGTSKQRNRPRLPIVNLHNAERATTGFLEVQKELLQLKKEKNEILLRSAIASEQRAKSEAEKAATLKHLLVVGEQILEELQKRQ